MKSAELNNNTTINFEDAIESNDPKMFAKAMEQRMQSIEDNLKKKYDELKDERDEQILASRGIYPLTDEEKSFYDQLFKNEIGNNPEKGGTLLIPKTIVQRVFEDMKNDDTGVMGLIDFQHTTGASEWLISISEKPVAAWGELCEPITQELKAGFKVVNTLVNKLSCYVPYCRSLIDLGYSWQDAYVREYMALGLSSALSIAAISGNGTKRPWGMIYDYNIDDDTATIKTAKVIKKFDKATFAPIFAAMCKNPMGYHRSLAGLTLFVDSETYYAHVYANNGELNANGVYVTLLDQLGIQVKVTETGLTAGQAVLGLPKRYFMEMGFKGNPNGMIEFSDDYLFLDDKRVYKGKLYADGFPKDNNAFVLLDLTKMGTGTGE